MAAEKIPLVSVVIPMFNAALFVGQTLESLQRQTLKDFEIIIVDDCSTDNSVDVVENFARPLIQAGVDVRIAELPENTGMPGVVRNVALDFVRGKYVTFLDADDLLTATALEELSTLAEQSQAEVVHTDTFFLMYDSADDLTICQSQQLPVVSAPTFETTDVARRVENWIGYGYNWESVTMFCRADFLAANNLRFPALTNNEDMLFSFAALCLAEKFLRVPNVTYIYRQRDDSVSQKQFTEPAAHFRKWLRVLKDGMAALEKFMASVNFFVDRPDYRCAVEDFYFSEILKAFDVSYEQSPPYTFTELIRREFHPDDAILAAHLFNAVNVYRHQLRELLLKQ